MKKMQVILILLIFISNLAKGQNEQEEKKHVLNRTKYKDKLKGFWLGSCIVNWTGLPTENQRTDFPSFTDDDFGTGKFDYVLDQRPWGTDDDTDIEYVYQHAIENTIPLY